MTSERWGTIQSLFLAAAPLGAADRAAFLTDACLSDASLRRDVEGLLAAEERSGGDGFIEQVIAAAAGRLAAEGREAPRTGEQVGPYRLIREIGHGGMGTVYLAERVDEQYRATVAIKFVRGALAAPEFARRFRIERQILADLSHPNIAWLLDGGTASDGTPYLVMEYVDGQPIDAWCEARQLGLSGRLALFRQVCAAVQHAHQALVVHRDLKPSNILVTPDGTPKLVDFGIAKLVTGDDGADPTTTLRLLTPAYAAPEQVRGTRITVATDVYGLGAVLYRLLCGRTPLDLTDASPGEIERRICEVEAEPPSAAVVGVSVAWRRRLAGDLDTIALKALRKEPERRYASVAQLADDVQRHLDGRPVLARPDTLGYRAGRFLRRHRTGVAVALAILALSGAYVWSLSAERDRARQEAAKASEVARFLTDLFQVSNPEVSRGRDVTARELLDRGATRIGTELAGQPAVQATMLGVMSGVYNRLGFYDDAERTAEEALRIRRSLYGNDHADVAAAAAELATARGRRGDDAGAQAMAREVLRIRRALHRGDHPDVADALAEVARALRDGEKLNEAEPLYHEALEMARRVGGDPMRIASLTDGLASTLQRKGDYAGSVPLFRETVAIVRQQTPVDSLLLAISINNLAIPLTELGHVEEAEPLYREALAIFIAFHGEGHPWVSAVRSGLSRLLREVGRLEEAKAFALTALGYDTVRLGAGHPDIATKMGRIGVILIAQDSFAAAERYLRRALAIRRAALGPEHPYTAISINELAELFRERGDLVAAEAAYREALALRRRVHPPTHPYLAYSLTGLATVLLARGRPAAAEPLLQEALTIREAALPPGHRLRVLTDSLLTVARRRAPR